MMEANEIRRRAVLIEQSAFRACAACAGEVAHTHDGMICARKPAVPDCALLAGVNGLRGATGAGAEAMLAEMTESWAMSHVGGNVRTSAPDAPVKTAARKK